MRTIFTVAAAFCCLSPGSAATLKPETAQAFDRYVQGVETRVNQELAGSRAFLWADGAPGRLQRLHAGNVLTEPWTGKGTVDVSGGLIHDWIGAVFIPGATVDKTLAVLQDYNHHKLIYQPEVIDSRLLEHNGNQFRIWRLRLLRKKMINAVFDTEFKVEFRPLDTARWYSRSDSTKIAEIEDYGKASQHLLPVGTGSGYLWRLTAFWKIQQRDNGVYLECQAISLTREMPTGLAWLVGSVVRSLPQDSLQDTLRATRDAVRQAFLPVASK